MVPESRRFVRHPRIDGLRSDMSEATPDTPPPCGLLIVDKPRGPSSMGVIRVVRARLHRGKRFKVGHAGTLDPLASGVLLICVGKATKQIASLMNTDKRYVATVDLSAFTTTDDAEGERTTVDVETPPTRDAIEGIIAERFVGEIMQTPPAFSAMKVDGRRAYDLARKGKPVELKPRPVLIHEIDVLEYAWPTVVLDIRCGKGTYIRSLARDIGTALNTGGTLVDLRRTAVGAYTIDNAITLDDVPDPLTQSSLRAVTASSDADLPDSDAPS